MLLFIGLSIEGFAQQRSLTGIVRDGSSTPLPGVTVTVKGSQRATSTDVSGSFSIMVSTGETLVFSNVGYLSHEEAIRNQSQLNVQLQKDDRALDEVFVVAYGTARKSTYTGSASTLNFEKESKDIPVTSFEQAINGKMAGVQINTTSGQAGSTSTIRVRGIGSMNASNEPLYVIDGVPIVSGNVGQMSDQLYTTNNIMSTINPNDIESLTVLKDAAASALYGSRAANGVVIITTKKGKLGKPQLNFRSSVALTPSWATDNYETGSPQQEINYHYQIFHDVQTSQGESDETARDYALTQLNNRFGKHGYSFTTNGSGLYENVIISGRDDGIENREGKFYDWQDALFRTGVYQTNDLSASGGTEHSQYYSSLSYTKDKGRAYTNDYERIGGRLNLNQKIGDYIEFGSNINIGYTNKSGFNDTRNLGTNYFYLSNNLLFPFYWPTDYKTGEPYTARFGSLGYNPLYFDTQWENSSKTLRISAIESLTIKFTPELTGKTIFSYDNSEVKDHLYYSPLHYHATYGSTANGSVFEYSTNIKKIVSSSTLNFDKTFGEHSVSLLAGFEAEKNQTDYTSARGSNLPSSALHTVSTAGKLDAAGYFWGGNMLSVLSKAEYNYQEKYFVSGSFRRDGSSRLGPDTRWGSFWSLAGSWNLKKERFLEDSDIFSSLRVKASYGVNGTLPISNYGWRSLASYGYNYNNEPGGILTTVADPNLTWETSYTTNFGLDFGILNDRLNATIEYFSRDSKNLLQDVSISTVTGFPNTLKNIGKINNQGLEFGLSGDIISNDQFRWSANINGTFLKSKVKELSEGQDELWWDPTGGDSRVQFIYREGESVYSFYTTEWAGVDAENGNPVWYTNDGTDGDFLFNGRGATNNQAKAQQIISGSPTPKLYGGLGTDLNYKNFSLGLSFIYKVGGKLFDHGSRDVAEDGYYWERVRSKYHVENVWTPDNTHSLYPKISGNDKEGGINRSTRHLYDASFLRLKNVNLAYNLPAEITNQIGLSNTRIFFNGTNLLTFSKFKWADPEVNQYGTRGWEMPFGKTYTFGIEVNF